MKNLILCTNSYKQSHYLMYPPRTQTVYSYIESREGEDTIFFGIQAFIHDYLSKRITLANIQEAEHILKLHMPNVPFNRQGWLDILYEHDGFLPLKIYALPEGTCSKARTVLLTVENVGPKYYWLPGIIETALLRAIWYPTSVASNSFHLKQEILNAYKISSDGSLNEAEFKLHDFGARGVSSGESAGLGGLAHLLNFKGTDTLKSIVAGRKYYNEFCAGYAVAAAEHSVITSWRIGDWPNEELAVLNILDNFAKPGHIVSIVGDSYDIYNFCENIIGSPEMVNKIKKSGATIVVRPDSGDPLWVPIECLRILAGRYGYDMNSKSYMVLDSIRVLQGDGITWETLPKLIKNVLTAGFSIDNIAFGMGGGLLQQVNRDTYNFAMKCSAIQVDGQWRDVYKQPQTQAMKASKRGLFNPIEYGLKLYYDCGKEYNLENFSDIRDRVSGYAKNQYSGN